MKDFFCEDLFNFCYDDEPPFSSSDIASSRVAEQPLPMSTTTKSYSFVPLSSSHSCQIEPTQLTSSTYIPTALSPFIPLEPSSSRLSTSRLAQPKTDKQVQTQRLEGIPKSTLHDTRYCVNLWEQWRTNQYKITAEHIGSIDSLSDQSLNHWLTRFYPGGKKTGWKWVPSKHPTSHYGWTHAAFAMEWKSTNWHIQGCYLCWI